MPTSFDETLGRELDTLADSASDDSVRALEVVLGRVVEPVAADRTVGQLAYHADEVHIVCPWHGYEYDVTTGRCAADADLRLESYAVQVKGDEIWLET